MDQNIEFTAKQILSNPVEAFTELHPDTSRNQIDTLEDLKHRRQILRKHRDQIRIQANIISRRIGKAKRDGQPCESLKLSMHEKSAQLKVIRDSLDKTERRILDFFDLGEDDKLKSNIIPLDSRRTRPAPTVDTQTVSISLLGNQESEWNAYVDNHPASSLYHRAEWKKVIHETYSQGGFYYVARNVNKGIVGILPLIHLSSYLFGDFLVTTPYFMHGGAIADHPSIEQMLMQQANDNAASLGIDHIEYRDSSPRNGLPVRLDKVNMILPLPDTCTELWSGFSSKLRAQIKRATREKPKILFGGKEFLDDFHKVYSRNMRDLGSPTHSKEFILNVLDSFPDNSWIIVLYLNARPVSAGFLISHSDTLEIPLASTIREVNPLSLNMLLYWEMLKFASLSGFKYFSFGRSTKDTGTFRFKRQWGAKPQQLYWNYGLLKNNELPHLSPANPKYALLINAWKRMPVNLTNWLGPKIVKNIP